VGLRYGADGAHGVKHIGALDAEDLTAAWIILRRVEGANGGLHPVVAGGETVNVEAEGQGAGQGGEGEEILGRRWKDGPSWRIEVMGSWGSLEDSLVRTRKNEDGNSSYMKRALGKRNLNKHGYLHDLQMGLLSSSFSPQLHPPEPITIHVPLNFSPMCACHGQKGHLVA